MMMTLTGRTKGNLRTALGDLLPTAVTSAEDWVTARSMIAATGDLTESAQFVTDELHALRRDHAKLQQAIFEAAQIQRKLCAPRELLWGEYEVAGEIFPVRHLSGDFFKVMELPSGLGLALGDIAGKGLTAGIWQAHLMGLLQRAARSHRDPAEVVAEVNHQLCHQEGAPPLTALFFAHIDSRTNGLHYCNAGLPAPLLLRSSRTLERLEEGGPMLGAVNKANFHTGRVNFDPGDMLVAYSDGVTECRNTQDDEFEMERLTGAAAAVSGGSASKALFSLLATVLDFADSCSPGDDVTLLVLRRRDAIKSEQHRSREKDYSAPPRQPASVLRPKRSGRGGRGSK
jgi:serine phosphatase RsbU (regulator of sigma subunit)